MAKTGKMKTVLFVPGSEKSTLEGHCTHET
jgi:hypothetical protein